MFLDMGTSQDINAAFRDSEPSDALDSSMLVLTAGKILFFFFTFFFAKYACFCVYTLNIFKKNVGAWPINSPKSTFSPPSIIAEVQKRFNDFYNARHSGRRLTWLYNMCKVCFIVLFKISFYINFFVAPYLQRKKCFFEIKLGRCSCFVLESTLRTCVQCSPVGCAVDVQQIGNFGENFLSMRNLALTLTFMNFCRPWMLFRLTHCLKLRKLRLR